MKIENFIVKRLIRREVVKRKKNDAIKQILSICIFGITISVAVMQITYSVASGFQKKIRDKIINFGGDFEIKKLTLSTGIEETPIADFEEYYNKIKNIDEVESIQSFILKAGIFKTKEEIQGVLVKGISFDFNWAKIKDNIVEGQAFEIQKNKKSNKILISKSIAEINNLKINDTVYIFFIKNQKLRPRKFFISGMYSTDIEDIDNQIVLIDLKHLQKINKWDSTTVTGYEIFLKNSENIEKTEIILDTILPYNVGYKRISEQFYQIFNWLDMIDLNIFIVFFLMILVSVVTIITALLVLIINRTKMIGILKSLGAKNDSIQKIFLYQAIFIVIRGIVYGNIIFFLIYWIQNMTSIISLDQNIYYISKVPMLFNPLVILLLNLIVMILSILSMILPTFIIVRISPLRTMNLR